MHKASVLPVTLRSEVTVGLSDTLQQLQGPSDEPMLGHSELPVTLVLHIAVTPC